MTKTILLLIIAVTMIWISCTQLRYVKRDNNGDLIVNPATTSDGKRDDRIVVNPPVPTRTPIPNGSSPAPSQPAPDTAKELNDYLGANNWKKSDRPDMIKVINWPVGKAVGGPIFDVDKDEVKYHEGQVPRGSGPATGWLKNPFN